MRLKLHLNICRELWVKFIINICKIIQSLEQSVICFCFVTEHGGGGDTKHLNIFNFRGQSVKNFALGLIFLYSHVNKQDDD